MQPVFAAHVDLVHDEQRQGQDEVAVQVVGWAQRRFGVALVPWQNLGRTLVLQPNGHAEAHTWVLDDRRLWRLDVRHAHDKDDTLAWSTTVWLGEDGASRWLRVRVEVHSMVEGRIAEPIVQVGSPGVLRRCMTDGLTRMDGIDPGLVRDVTTANVAAFVSFLSNRERRLPVVLVSQARDGIRRVDPDRLLQRLAGVAHVATIDTAPTFALSEAVTPRRSCFDGAVRLYWPGFTDASDPYRHPLFLKARLDTLGEETFVDDLVLRVGRVAATALGTPALERELRREEAVRRDRESRAAIDATIERLRAQEIATGTPDEGGLSPDEFVAFSEELRQLESRALLAEEKAFELELELESEQAARTRAEEQASLAWRAMGRPEERDQSAEEELPPPRTAFEAVERAQATVGSLLITEGALKAAEQSQYNRPAQVLEDLLKLDDVCRAWAEDRLPAGGFRVAFGDAFSAAFRPGISDTAKRSYRSDYEIEYNGARVLLGPHVARGVGQPSQILRIYWYADDANRRLVVGHVGRKLRDDGNRN